MKAVYYTEITEKGLLLHYPNESFKMAIIKLWNSAKKRFNGYLSIDVERPYPARTTGKGSQNSLFWKLVAYISNETGDTPEAVELDLKLKAVAKGYPYHVSRITGRMIPESMTKINTVQMSYLIDTAYEVCSFLGIVLEPTLKEQEK